MVGAEEQCTTVCNMQHTCQQKTVYQVYILYSLEGHECFLMNRTHSDQKKDV